MKTVIRSDIQNPSRRSWLFVLHGLLTVVLACTGCTRAHKAPEEAKPADLVVFAAASLRNVLTDLAPAFESARPVKLVFNFAGSNDLARQIVATHGADVFLSASDDWMDHVERAGLVALGSRKTFLSNHLVVVAPLGSTVVVRAPQDLATVPFDVLALGDPKGVPAGQYAKEWLEHARLADGTVWDRVKDRVAPSPDVRAALAMTEAHEGAVGIVYRSDAVRSTKVKVLYEVSDDLGPKIRYAAAAIAGRPREADARAFVAFLASATARARFERDGFVVPAP